MTDGPAASCAVLIVGGGPAGLFLAALLAQRGVDVAVLERRTAPSSDSRAIGLHPPALQALAELDLARDAREAGQQIRRGSAWFRTQELGSLRFARAGSDDGCVLALPQSCTEALLEARLAALSPSALRRGWEVTGLEESQRGVTVTAHRTADERVQEPGPIGPLEPRGPFPSASRRTRLRFHAPLVVAADGSRSPVRELLRLSTRGRQYPETYVMGDFADPAPAGQQREAAVHLEQEGVVESFPLPERRRRWVVHTGGGTPLEHSPDELVAKVRERTGFAPDPVTVSMISSFTVRRRAAERLLTRRCVLIGDAAHEISPIGGQGMTLAWLDALDLAPLAARKGVEGDGRDLRTVSAWRSFERRVRHRARTAGMLAAANTVLGRPAPAPVAVVRAAMVRAVLHTPLRHVMAWAYSMGWTRRR